MGNFKKDNQTNYISLPPPAGFTYNGAGYYIDDVSVSPLDSMPLKADAGKDTSIANIGDSVFIGSLTNGITNITWYNSLGKIINTQAPGFYVKPSVSTFYIVEQTVCGYTSRDTVNVAVGTVPLKFISYNVSIPLLGAVRGGLVENVWTTANEINVSHFNIQRSINGKDFTTIGKVAAQNKITNEYIFSVSPLVDGSVVVYYRIESIDKDGKTSYTEIKKITFNDPFSTFNLFPNPAKAFVTIECKGMKEIKVINQLGQVIKQLKNPTEHQTINTEQFAKGIYIVQVVTAKNATEIAKFVKQ